MNFWYIEHYGASFGDDIDAKMNYFKHTEYLMHSRHQLLQLGQILICAIAAY